jgi:uncharacterized membrane protein YphA (DoxX/SURF4 family)
MSAQSKRPAWWHTAIRIAVGGLLLVLAFDKFIRFSDLEHFFRTHYMLPDQLNAAAAYLLSGSEVLIGVLFLTGNAMAFGAIFAVIPIAVDVILLVRTVPVVCDCETVRPFLGMATPREPIAMHLCLAVLLAAVALSSNARTVEKS